MVRLLLGRGWEAERVVPSASVVLQILRGDYPATFPMPFSFTPGQYGETTVYRKQLRVYYTLPAVDQLQRLYDEHPDSRNKKRVADLLWQLVAHIPMGPGCGLQWIDWVGRFNLIPPPLPRV